MKKCQEFLSTKKQTNDGKKRKILMKICYTFNLPVFHWAQRYYPPYIKFMQQSQCFYFSGLRFGAAWIETVWWEIWIFHEAKGTWRNHANLKSDAFSSSSKRGFFAIFWGVTGVFYILSTPRWHPPKNMSMVHIKNSSTFTFSQTLAMMEQYFLRGYFELW